MNNELPTVHMLREQLGSLHCSLAEQWRWGGGEEKEEEGETGLMMAYVDVVAVMSQIGDGSRRNNEDNKAKWMVRGWGVCVLFILFFSFLSSFFVFVLYFPLFFLLCFVCFSSLVVCFLVLLYVSFFVFFFPYVLFFFCHPLLVRGYL